MDRKWTANRGATQADQENKSSNSEEQKKKLGNSGN
jgi:hypothetical protein